MHASCASVCRYPSAQSHSSILPLPATESEFTGHATHAAAAAAAAEVLYKPTPHKVQGRGPVVSLYDPAAHAVHAPPFAPVYPALHWQAVARLLPTEDIEFRGQFSQAEDAVAPTTVEYVLTTQSMHVGDKEAPKVVEYLPAPQSIQELTPGAPGVVRYLPAPQSRHVTATEAPDVVEYLPATQSMHVPVTEAPDVVEYLPATQLMHAVASVAPGVVRYLPASHSRHTDAPVKILYFPAAHAVQLTPLCPVYPRLHRQLVESVEPLVD